jgi:serine/threonine protein kinase
MFKEHENIVRMHDHFEIKNDLITVYEYCGNGELMKYIEKNSEILGEKERVKLFC